jgi:hypothetical protein
LERQYIIFAAVAAAAFVALIVLANYNPLQQSKGDGNGNVSDVIKAKKGKEVFIRYSAALIKRIQSLPTKNSVEVEVSSELHNSNLAGIGGELTYTDMAITFVRGGEKETISDDIFKTIEYRFLPDAGNKTSYVYENVRYIGESQDSQVVLAVKPLSTAKIGEHYKVRLVLHTGGIVDYQVSERMIEIVP